MILTCPVKNGNILFVSANLISLMGLPMLAVQGLGKLQGVNAAIKTSSIVKAQVGANASACFFINSVFDFTQKDCKNYLSVL